MTEKNKNIEEKKGKKTKESEEELYTKEEELEMRKRLTELGYL